MAKQTNNVMIGNDQIFDNLITVDEFCRLTKFRPRTVYNWIHREPEFPFLKWGRSIRLETQKVLTWLESKGAKNGHLQVR